MSKNTFSDFLLTTFVFILLMAAFSNVSKEGSVARLNKANGDENPPIGIVDKSDGFDGRLNVTNSTGNSKRVWVNRGEGLLKVVERCYPGIYFENPENAGAVIRLARETKVVTGWNSCPTREKIGAYR